MLKKKRLIAIALVILLGLFSFVPIPAYIETVGDAQNVGRYVTVSGSQKAYPGSFMLTYVELGQATPALYVASYFDKYATRLPSSSVTGASSAKEYKKVQHYYMDDALNQAKTVSLSLAGKPVKQNFKGIVVMSILKDSAFKDKLRVGDVITGVNGQRCVKTTDLLQCVHHTKQAVMSLRYQRNGETKTVTGRMNYLPQINKRGLGITFIQKAVVSSPVKIKINMDGIEGPSAGLMLTLEMYSQLSHENLKKGRKITGTGTILSDGAVGDIGGIDKKVVAAARKKAVIFFAPDNTLTQEERTAGDRNNYQEAKKTAQKLSTKMKIVPVKNIQDALSYLRKSSH
ncbi:SepM family pheromone-processing serine protease [Liquorilactobacillus capillatus]|uniref:ATP-dependent protease La n=1 Tax=Liquorilactobacillus capillatus DSM 19910 TaxID=1423731 RepID=A0A0R1M0D4_9LACO|nr:SepM family pheromone-processing serine protease [Liquorilactobacillus capillatus]KRL01383.1 ATP-dependent protease La [Liquorilactobacillus capillatus DSM 19910]